MLVRIDQRLFEILNERGVSISLEEFKKAYVQRKQERDSGKPNAQPGKK
jgi:hypothetical protein